MMMYCTCSEGHKATSYMYPFSYLCLGIGSYPRECPIPTALCHLHVHFVSQHYGQRHALRGLISGVAIHQPLWSECASGSVCVCVCVCL